MCISLAFLDRSRSGGYWVQTVFQLSQIYYYCYLDSAHLEDWNSLSNHVVSADTVMLILSNIVWTNSGQIRKWFLPRCMECRRGLAMRMLSVRPSVTRVDCDKTVARSVQIYIPYERTFSLVFWEKEWLVGATPSTWNFGSTGPR